jgi:hypothetical protein
MRGRDLFIAALQKDAPADPRTQVILHGRFASAGVRWSRN